MKRLPKKKLGTYHSKAKALRIARAHACKAFKFKGRLKFTTYGYWPMWESECISYRNASFTIYVKKV